MPAFLQFFQQLLPQISILDGLSPAVLPVRLLPPVQPSLGQDGLDIVTFRVDGDDAGIVKPFQGFQYPQKHQPPFRGVCKLPHLRGAFVILPGLSFCF